MRARTLSIFVVLFGSTLAAAGCRCTGGRGGSGGGASNTPTDGLVEEKTASGCGRGYINGKEIVFDCDSPDYGKIEGAQKRLDEVGSGTSESELPESVDHREEGTEGPIRDQGRMGSCTAMSLAAAIDHAVARYGGKPGFVSVMHLFSRYRVMNMNAAYEASKGKGVAPESLWPYNDAEAHSYLVANQCDPRAAKVLGKPCGADPDETLLAKADKNPAAKIVEITELEFDEHVWKEVLAKGQDIWFAMHAEEELLRVRGDTVHDFKGSGAKIGHAMTIVGYQPRDGQTWFLLKNSWGEGWGAKGYSYISAKNIKNNLRSAYIVDAKPMDGKNDPPKKTKRCAGEKVPDAHTGECVKACDDGSPPNDGECAEVKGCKPGYVKRSGKCVPEAPKSKKGEKNGIKWDCHQGGCVYTIPSGKYGCPSDYDECEVSCEAPEYVLSISKNEYACTE